MSNLPIDKAADSYRKYRYQEIIFDKKTVEAMGLIEREIRLQWGKFSKPCRLLSASLAGAKVEATLTKNEMQSIFETEALTVLYSFMGFRQLFIPLSFPVSYTLSAAGTDILELKNGGRIISLSSDKSPPEYLLGIFGDYLRLNSNVSKRLEERIVINADSAARLGLKTAAANIVIDGETKRCVLLDLSFSGSGCMLSAGAARKPARGVLQVLFLDPDVILEIPGKVVQYRQIRGGEGLYLVGLRFDEETVPVDYRKRINAMHKNT